MFEVGQCNPNMDQCPSLVLAQEWSVATMPESMFEALQEVAGQSCGGLGGWRGSGMGCGKGDPMDRPAREEGGARIWHIGQILTPSLSPEGPDPSLPSGVAGAHTRVR